MSEIIFKTYLRDHRDEEAMARIHSNPIDPRLSESDSRKLKECLTELLANNRLYTPDGYDDVVFVQAARGAAPDRLSVTVQGVINEARWKNLQAKVQLTHGKTADELLALRNHFIYAQSSKAGLSQEDRAILGATDESKGISIGIIDIACHNGFPLNLARGEALADGLFLFRLNFDFQLAQPLPSGPAPSPTI